jgi:hypothetical protein
LQSPEVYAGIDCTHITEEEIAAELRKEQKLPCRPVVLRQIFIRRPGSIILRMKNIKTQRRVVMANCCEYEVLVRGSKKAGHTDYSMVRFVGLCD